MTSPIKFEVEVAQIIKHSLDVFTFEFNYLGKKPIFKPGQFMHLALDEFDYSRHWPESRPFSVASAPSALDSFYFTISKQGHYTARLLNELQRGDRLWMKGPYGDFIVQPKYVTDNVVYIAGGTGLTPFCSYFDEIVLNKSYISNSIVLYYGAKNADLLIYRNLINQARIFIPDFKDFYFVEEKIESDIDVICGRLNIKYIVEQLHNPYESIFYLSGPNEMIMNFKNYLIHDVHLPVERVCIDEWI